jgi:nicotinate-nucleotide pyrophosphorylase
MNMIILFYILIMVGISSVAQKWQIQIINCSLLDVRKHYPNVTAIVNAANVYMRGGEKHKEIFNEGFFIFKK